MTDQYIYLGTQNLSGKVWGGFTFNGGVWKIKTDGASTLKTGGRFDPTGPDGFSCTFNVAFSNDTDASTFLAYCAGLTHDAGIAFYNRTSSWYFLVWGIALKQLPIDVDSPTDYNWYMYQVTLYFYSPYTYQATPTTWALAAATLGQSKALSNTGHYSASFESLAVTCHLNQSNQKMADLRLGNNWANNLYFFTGLCNAEEIWTLYGNDNRLIETYNLAAPTSLYPFLYDWTVNVAPTYASNKILINNGNYAYLKLPGPNLSSLPVMMTANISLDSGGSSGLAYIDMSPDAVSWTTVKTQADFVSGTAVYYLPGTEFMTNIYVRFRNASGSAGYYLRIGAIRFDVTRKIASGSVPLYAVGSSTATLGCNSSYSLLVDVAGTFRSIRHMV